MASRSRIVKGPIVSHGGLPRGLEGAVRSRLHTGRFGRMFRHLPPCEHQEGDLIQLASAMIEARPNFDIDEEQQRGSKLYSGFTYLGQFIDHDLTFDPISRLGRDTDPDALTNFRTPRFDLDCLYGSGPDEHPFLYDLDRTSFVIGNGKPTQGEDDLPRNGQGIAIIPDSRNDSNIIVSQIHLAFMKYHNKVVHELIDRYQLSGRKLFETATNMVRWHYQWLVLSDFLPTIIGTIDNPAPDWTGKVLDILTLESAAVSSAEGPSSSSTWKGNFRFFKWKPIPRSLRWRTTSTRSALALFRWKNINYTDSIS